MPVGVLWEGTLVVYACEEMISSIITFPNNTNQERPILRKIISKFNCPHCLKLSWRHTAFCINYNLRLFLEYFDNKIQSPNSMPDFFGVCVKRFVGQFLLMISRSGSLFELMSSWKKQHHCFNKSDITALSLFGALVCTHWAVDNPINKFLDLSVETTGATS